LSWFKQQREVNAKVIWVIVTDEYFTNQFGHPYQGSVYHAAARSNGFNFYQAFLFDAFGSVLWGLFYETNRPSIKNPRSKLYS
jgi:hypothetical protein